MINLSNFLLTMGRTNKCNFADETMKKTTDESSVCIYHSILLSINPLTLTPCRWSAATG